MSAPVTPSDFKDSIADPSGSLCSAFLKVILKLPVTLYKLVKWMLDDTGNLTADFINGVVPSGSLLFSCAPNPPTTGYLLCNGSAVLRASYPSLFTAIGTIYGVGDDSTTFNLPDYRDKFPVGAGAAYGIGATGGSATVKLTVGQLPKHTHPVDDKYNGIIATAAVTNHGALAGSTGDAQSQTDAIGEAGNDEEHPNLPPYVACFIYIKT